MSTERICGTGGWNGPKPGDPDNNIGIQAVGAVAGIKVTWGYPGINPHAVAHGKLYRSNSATNPGNVIAIVNGSMFFDSLEPEDLTTYYYWIELVSVNGTVADKVGPASARAESYGDNLYTYLRDKIDEGVLATSLRQKIDRIGLNSLGITNEILERAKTEDALGAAYNIVEAHSGDTRALLEEEVLARTTANEAFVAQVNTLYASKAEIYYQGTAPTGGSLTPLKIGAFWFDTSDGDKSYRWDGSSWKPVSTATIDQTNAAVQDNNRAMIGYCAVNGSPSQHLTAEACSAAGGSWIAAAPFAQALKTVQVTDAQGNMASVQQRMESYQTTLGDLGSLYTVQVDNGVIGGFGVYNDGSTVQAGFNVDTFWIGKPGDDQYTGKYPFMISGNDILFRGKVSFSSVEDGPPADATRNVFKGQWQSTTSYTLGDVVVYNGNGWIAKTNSYNNPPPINSGGSSSYWTIHTVKGDTPTVTNNGNGTYTIEGDNGTITVHDGTDAPIPTVTDLGGGAYRINDGSGNTVTVEDGYTPQKGIDYFDGNTGDYHSWIYRESTYNPGSPTGGSFTGSSEQVPSGWSDTPPSNPTNIVWVSRAVYTQYVPSHSSHPNWYRRANWSYPSKFYERGADGQNGQDGLNGQDGQNGQDGSASMIVYNSGTSSPYIPNSSTGVPSGWSTSVPTSGIVWESTGNKSATSNYYYWSAPRVSADHWRKPDQTTINGNMIFTGEAYVDTLEIKGNAVTVPDGYYNSWATNGSSSGKEIAAQSVYMHENGRINISFSCRQGYSSGARWTEFDLQVKEGSLGSWASCYKGRSGAYQDFVSFSYSMDAAAYYRHYARVIWKTEDSSVEAAFRNLTIMGLKR